MAHAGVIESGGKGGKGFRLPSASARLADYDEVQFPPTDDAPTPLGAAPGPSLPEQPAATEAAPLLPAPSTEEPPAAGPPPFAGIVGELSHLHCALPVTVTVDFDLDELAERVMERIAQRMVGR